MPRQRDFKWKIPVPEFLQTGGTFTTWTETKNHASLEFDCAFSVDEDGFYLSWRCDNGEGHVIDLANVREIKDGGIPEDHSLLYFLSGYYETRVDKCSLTISSSADCVNVMYQCIVFPDIDTAKLWKDSLESLIGNIKMKFLSPMNNLKKVWVRTCLEVNSDNLISCENIAKAFMMQCSASRVCEILDSLEVPCIGAQSIGRTDFTFEIFLELYKAICPRNDIYEIYKNITKVTKSHLTVDQLADFLGVHGYNYYTIMMTPALCKNAARDIISRFERSEPDMSESTLSENGWLNYMMSDDNSLVNLDYLEQHMDMNHPLSHYFINSSHNTYLTGWQVMSKSSVEMYRQVLLSGCRCIELDCWDGYNGEPTITHGPAMCTVINFKDVIEAIHDTAFITSEYPVILSIENHCCLTQQYKMAKYCREIFGDMLLDTPLADFQLIPEQPLPSPNDLKRKILIKNKRLKRKKEQNEMKWFNKNYSNHDSKFENKKLEYYKNFQRGYLRSESKLHPLLSSMVNYVQSTKFHGFRNSKGKNLNYEMFSFNESEAMALIRYEIDDFVTYTKNKICRTYPKATRFDSSNYIPQSFWNVGCQMVSLNFQTPDIGLQLNQAKFEINSNCGYVLKPECLRHTEMNFDPAAESSADGIVALQCTVQVISGQFINSKMVDIEVSIHGLPADSISFHSGFKAIKEANTFFNTEPFLFRKIIFPELAMLHIVVREANDNIVGQRALPFNFLKSGYKHITLRCPSGSPLLLSSLFCYIEMKTYVPQDLEEVGKMLTDPKDEPSTLDETDSDFPPFNRQFYVIKVEPMSVASLKKNLNFDHYLQKQMTQLQKIRLKQLKEISKIYDMIQVSKLKERKIMYNEAGHLETLILQLQEKIWHCMNEESKMLMHHIEHQQVMIKAEMNKVHQEQLKYWEQLHKSELDQIRKSRKKSDKDEGRRKEVKRISIKERLSMRREKEETNRKRSAAQIGRLSLIHEKEIKILKDIQNKQREAVLKQLREMKDEENKLSLKPYTYFSTIK